MQIDLDELQKKTKGKSIRKVARPVGTPRADRTNRPARCREESSQQSSRRLVCTKKIEEEKQNRKRKAKKK